jgi:hypothetical protein
MTFSPNAHHLCYWYEFPTGNRAYGAGGWSRHAKHRPAPVLVRHIVRGSQIKAKGKSIFVNGIRKLKLTIVVQTTGQIIREDYDLHRITPLDAQEDESATPFNLPASVLTPTTLHRRITLPCPLPSHPPNSSSANPTTSTQT